MKQPKNSLVSIAGFIRQYWNVTVSVEMDESTKYKSICKESLAGVIRKAAQLHRMMAFIDIACS